MKSLLMIAFHFPPLAGSSGIQRTLRFAKHLPQFGWHPTILTTHERAYERTSHDQLGDIPDGVEVVRAPAWDTARHLALGGHYPRALACPDRWLSWWPGAVWVGSKLMRRSPPDAIWSTYPIATAHLIGASLARRSGVPWIADFRDPMAQDDYPTDPMIWRSFDRIERRTVEAAAACTFTTPSALAMYRDRYPRHGARLSCLENGYDEDSFQFEVAPVPLNPGKLTLLHSGIVYPSERDPTFLFEALRLLKEQHPEAFARVVLRFRAPVHEELLRELAARNTVSSAIEVLPPIGYADALSEMRRADGLLVLQASNCNAQIPAKLYEYLRAERPVLVFSDPAGDTATTANAAGITAVARLDSADAMMGRLERFVADPDDGTRPTASAVTAASRLERTRVLATLLDRLAAQR